MPPKNPRTWIIVADSARARAVRWVGRDAPLDSVDGFDLRRHHQRGRDIISDRPGRTHESQGTTRHAIEPRVDPVRETEHHFAGTVATTLDEHFGRGEFDRFVLVSGPTMLGDLRGALTARLQAAVHGELGKDLTHLTNAELKQHLLVADIF